MGKYGCGTRNERGERLLEFTEAHSFLICNTRFQQKSDRKWTWESPNGIHKNMIEMVLVERKWKTSILNCRTCQGADIKRRLKQPYAKPRHDHRVDASQLRDTTNGQRYRARLADNINNVDECSTIDQYATQITRAVVEAIQTTFTAKVVEKSPWIYNETLRLTDEKRTANTRQAYNVMEMLSKKYSPTLALVRDQDGTILQSNEPIN